MNCVCDESGPCAYHAEYGYYVRRGWWAWIPRIRTVVHSALFRWENPTWKEVLEKRREPGTP